MYMDHMIHFQEFKNFALEVQIQEGYCNDNLPCPPPLKLEIGHVIWSSDSLRRST